MLIAHTSLIPGLAVQKRLVYTHVLLMQLSRNGDYVCL